jgi:hypothetical protein
LRLRPARPASGPAAIIAADVAVAPESFRVLGFHTTVERKPAKLR